MAMNEIYRDAVSLPWPVAETVASGDLVVLDSGLAGVAETDAKPAEGGGFVATLRVDGVFAFPTGDVTGGVGEAAVADGATIGTVYNVTATSVHVALNR